MPRTRRVTRGTSATVIAKMTFSRLARVSAISAIAIKTDGIDISPSMIRITTASTQRVNPVTTPIATVIGIGVASLISGVVVTETVFAIPGLGRLTVDAILRRDYPIIQGIILIFSAAYVLINLLVDLSYTLLDPRIRY